MNSKASNVTKGSGPSAGDLAKYALAALVAIAGVVGFYFLPWPVPVRGLVVAAGFIAAIAILSFSTIGLQGREFLSESLFELRKVVWPTRQEATRITVVVLIVVVVISLILAGFDFVISWLVKLLLQN
jgi:preprotein translocase subunit SecE